VKAEPASGDPAAPAPGVSNRQQKINEYERRIAEQDQRIRALEAANGRTPATPGAAPAQPAADAVKKDPAWKRFKDMPDAPKLAEFDSVDDHAAAMALFISDQRDAERQQQSQAQHTQQEQERATHTRVETFTNRVQEAAKADPQFVASLSDEVKHLRPMFALQPGEQSGPLNILWELVYDSPRLENHLRHFSSNPGELRRLETVPTEIQALPAHQRVGAHINWLIQEFGAIDRGFTKPAAAPAPTPKTLTDAVDVQTLGRKASTPTDPKAAAVRSGNTRAYRELRRAERAQQHGRR
jgi:hypothetical protein